MDNKAMYQEIKETNERESFPLLSQTLSDFKYIDNNPDYLKLSNQLVIFKQLKKDQIYFKTEIPFDDIKTKLYFDLEESLTEVVLLNNQKVRNERLRKLNHWFNHTLNYFKSLIRIKERTTKDERQLIEKESSISDEELSYEEINKHRCNIEGFETPNIRLKEFERKEVSTPSNIRKMNMTDASSFRKTGEKFKRVNSGRSTNIKSTCYATQTGSKFFKPNPNSYISNVNNDDQRVTNSSNSWLNPSKEIKSSYSYLRAEYKYPHLVIEKEIIDNKMKIIEDKRHTDEVYHNIQAFAQQRAGFIQKVNKKHEMKDMIKKYRVIVEQNTKKEEDDKIRLAKEKKLKDMIEKENERKKKKELEEIKKKEEEESFQKSTGNYYKTTSFSNNLEQNKFIEKETINYLNDSHTNENKEDEEQREEREVEEDEEKEEEQKEKGGKIQAEEILKKPKEKVNTNEVKHISFSASPQKKVISISFKISKESIKMKNHLEMLQRKINERENALLETNQQTQISLPSDSIAYTNTSNIVLSLRAFNSKMLNIKQIDIPKDAYQKSLCPLSLYDQIHMQKTEPTDKARSNSNVFSFLYNSFQRNSNDYLNLRQTLSCFRENKYDLIRNNPNKQIGNAKITFKKAFCNPSKARSSAPMTYLPNPSNNLLHLK